ncbi:MAG: hypothetical protein Q9191_006407, partial [Dirinaria sp. TL-2023a]
PVVLHCLTEPPPCTCKNESRYIYESPEGLQGLEKYAFAPLAQQVLPGNAIRNAASETEGKFPFMRLCPELRTIVYKFHFFQAKKPGTIGEYCPAGDRCPNRVYNGHIPVRAIILVSKTVYAEAMPLYYRSRHFRFSNVSRLQNFLQVIGPRQASHIQHLSFTYSGIGASQAFSRLGMCISLKTLNIIIVETVEEQVDDLVKKVGVSALLGSVRGVETVTVDISKCSFGTEYATFVKLLGLLKLPRDTALPLSLTARLKGQSGHQNHHHAERA